MIKNNPNICNDCAYNGGAEKYTPNNFERGGIFNAGKVLTVNNKGWIEPLPGGGSVSWGSIRGTLSNQTDLHDALNNKLDTTKCTYQTTAPTQAITDGGVHIVYLNAEPATKYDGYIYLIKE